MALLTVLGNVLMATVGVGLIIFILYRVAVWARKRSEGAYVLATLFSPLMGVGNVVDPDHRIVDEAKQLKQKEEDDSGDPPDATDDASTPPAGQFSPPEEKPFARH
jgi:hypothetical protein